MPMKVESPHAICVVVDQIKPVLVVQGGKVGLSHGETDAVSKALTKGSSGDLNTYPTFQEQGVRTAYLLHTVGVAGFGMTRGLRVKLAERLEIVHRELVAEEVEEDIL
jgi:hypothetical protein